MTDIVIRRPGAELHCHQLGDAGPLLGYSHGIYFSPAVEDALGVLDWSGLARTRRILRYDQRGHGSSTGEPDPAHYRWPALADDLLAVADRAAMLDTDPAASSGADRAAVSGVDRAAVSGVDRAAVSGVDRAAGSAPVDWAGSSMGAASLLWAATKRPSRFRRLVLMIPPTVRETRVAAARSYLAAAAMVEQRGKAFWLRALRNFPPPAVFADVPTWVFDADVPEPLLPSLMRGAAASDLPPDEALAAVTHRTLILAWETDSVHPVTSARLLAGLLPGARLHVSTTVADIRMWTARIGAFLSEP